jgi:Tfp pilus assembly protein PilN
MATLAVMFVGALIIAFGIVGVIYKIWSNQITDLQKRQSQEKLRQTELALVKSQNAKYQQRLKDLETRINTIQALQNSRVGPVELMSALGNIVGKTNDIYIYTLAPAGERLKLDGQSGSVDSMASFLAFLKNSGSFDNVQLEQFYQDDQHERLTYKFALSCQFRSSTGGASPTGGALPEGAGGPGVGPSSGVPGERPGAIAPPQIPTRLIR